MMVKVCLFSPQRIRNRRTERAIEKFNLYEYFICKIFYCISDKYLMKKELKDNVRQLHPNPSEPL